MVSPYSFRHKPYAFIDSPQFKSPTTVDTNTVIYPSLDTLRHEGKWPACQLRTQHWGSVALS